MFMQKPIIAVDIDDVIAANAKGFVDWSNDRYGTNLTIDDYDDRWTLVWQVEHDEAEKRAIEYHASGHIGAYNNIDGAYEVLKKLSETFRLIVITARRNSINQLTYDWIEKYYPDIFENIIFAGGNKGVRNRFLVCPVVEVLFLSQIPSPFYPPNSHHREDVL